MCYETYDRLFWARRARRRADRSETPEREAAAKPEASKAPAEPATPQPAETREKEPA